MNKTTPVQFQRGFTLIEVLVATALLGLTVTMLSAGVTSNLKAVRDNRDNAAAKAYAQSMLEAYRSTWTESSKYIDKINPNFSTLPELPAAYKKTPPDVNITSVILTDAAGQDITKAKGKGYPQVMQVAVTIYKGTTPAVQLSTRISDPSERNKVK